jgi:hypothetical protein
MWSQGGADVAALSQLKQKCARCILREIAGSVTYVGCRTAHLIVLLQIFVFNLLEPVGQGGRKSDGRGSY